MFDSEMQASLIADGEKLAVLTGEDHGPWPLTTDETPCPRCEEVGLWRESADVGVGIIYGPYGCPCCGWCENEEYDLQKGGGVQEDGSYLDPYGVLLPSSNPIAKMLAREARRGGTVCPSDFKPIFGELPNSSPFVPRTEPAP